MNEFDLRKFLYENPLLEKKEDSKKGNKEEQKRMEGAIRDDRDHIKNLKGDIEDNEKKLAKLKKDFKKDVVKEDARTDAEEEGYEDGIKDEKEDLKETPKLTREGLKNMIREKITSILAEDSIDEAEDVDVDEEEDVDVDVEKDVNVDVEDEIDIDDESVESDIEVKTSVPGADADTDAVLGLLTKAQEEAEKLGDPKLLDQIGNTITFFTRKHVVKSTNEDLNEDEEVNELFGWGKKKGSSSGSGDEYVWYANSKDGKKRKIGSGSSESDAKSGWDINSYSKRYKVKNFTLEKNGEQIKSLNPTY